MGHAVPQGAARILTVRTGAMPVLASAVGTLREHELPTLVVEVDLGWRMMVRHVRILPPERKIRNSFAGSASTPTPGSCAYHAHSDNGRQASGLSRKV